VTSWDDIRTRLVSELAGLADEGFVVLGEPQPPREPARGWWRRRPPAAPVRYVQALRIGGHWRVECVGARSFGGDWDVDAPTDQVMRSNGWRIPGETDPTGSEGTYPNYWQVAPVLDSERIASACVEALALLGADPALLEWRTGP
jgi:hypothetical protein